MVANGLDGFSHSIKVGRHNRCIRELAAQICIVGLDLADRMWPFVVATHIDRNRNIRTGNDGRTTVGLVIQNRYLLAFGVAPIEQMGGWWHVGRMNIGADVDELNARFDRGADQSAGMTWN